MLNVFIHVASIYAKLWNKRKRLHKKRVQLSQDWFGAPTWPPFHCFGTPGSFSIDDGEGSENVTFKMN